MSSAAPPYRDPSAELEKRAEDLLARMTLDEKLAQLGCVWSTQLVEGRAFSERKARELLAHGTGQITRIGASTGLRPHESAAFANRIQRFLAEETRLGIPAIVHEESTAGLCARDADQFPQAIGLAATFDPTLVERIGRVIRAQMRAVGARHTLAPVLDVTRDPRWGRTEETYGECPYLASRLGVAYVRGVQGENLSGGVAATGKHFLGYGLSEGGLNHAPVQLGARELREVFAAPFAAAIAEAGLATVMNSYAAVDGLPCGGAKEILDDLLRGELGFDGLVVADYFTTVLLIAHHRVAADKGEAAELALRAGLDAELPQLDCYGAPLRERIEAGRVPEALVDRSVRRVLRLKLALGLFEAPYVDDGAADAAYQTPAARRLAREAAAKSLVLLRNEGALLPLSRGLRRVAVLGPAADDVRLHQGDYSYPAHVEIVYRRQGGDPGILPRSDAVAFAPGPYYPPTVTLLEGIRAAVSAGTEVVHARGCDVTGDDRSGFEAALAAARGADVAIACVGGKSGLLPDCTSGEFRDAADLGLTGAQQALVEALVATGTPVVVVLVNGRPLALPWIAQHVPAVLEAWLPGEEGGHAVADVLFGRTSPSGRLPITLPRAVGQVPVYYNHRAGGGKSQMLGDYSDLPVAPLYPFGHGLSYARFEYAALRIEPAAISTSGRTRVTLEVTNASDVEADEVVQLYARDPVASVPRPVKQLVGFLRVPLRPHQTRLVVFELDASQLAFYGQGGALAVEAGAIEVMVGASSADVRLEGRFAIEGERRTLRPGERVPTLAWAVA
ncbi:MAG TPA: glycoside hydrolase family 3 N-terminal domain-containing protein [Myxococcota bacterium]|nr:glycoside hydrolase family 3 N-terminal domain-containing protein [Myxococcota bacterium]